MAELKNIIQEGNIKANMIQILVNKLNQEILVGQQLVMPIRGSGTTVRNGLSVLNRFSGTGPAVLVEIGFITNTNDAELMTAKSAEIGKQIALGIYKYITGGYPPSASNPFFIARK